MHEVILNPFYLDGVCFRVNFLLVAHQGGLKPRIYQSSVFCEPSACLPGERLCLYVLTV